MEEMKNLDKGIYGDLIKSVNIESIKLSNLSIEDMHIEKGNSLSVNLEFINEKFYIEENILKVIPNFLVTVSDNNNANTLIFKIDFEYKVEYRFKNLSKVETSYIELFVRRNVPVNIWPYARELISSLTTRMGYPALIIEPLT